MATKSPQGVCLSPKLRFPLLHASNGQEFLNFFYGYEGLREWVFGYLWEWFLECLGEEMTKEIGSLIPYDQPLILNYQNPHTNISQHLSPINPKNTLKYCHT